MKIQLISDTHGYDYEIDKDADVIVHAGDFSNSYSGILAFHQRCKDLNKEYIAVLGNHDYYRVVLDNFQDSLISQGIKLLTQNNSIEINGYTFVGGTLFTNFRHNRIGDCIQFDTNKKLAEDCVYDFLQIGYKEKLVGTNDYVTFFNTYYNNINKYRNKDNVIVVTHFPPHVDCTAPAYLKSDLNPYFINDLDLQGFKLWLCGHIHHFVDIERDGCRIVSNPLGYLKEQGLNGFKSKFILDI